MIFLADDIESNLGRFVNNKAKLSKCHWNLNSIAIDNFIRSLLLEAYLATYNIDIICLSETKFFLFR